MDIEVVLTIEITLEVLSEPIKQSPSRYSVVEANLCEQDTLKQLCTTSHVNTWSMMIFLKFTVVEDRRCMDTATVYVDELR